MDRDIEEYHLKVQIATSDWDMLIQYAKRANCTAETLVQAFINDLVRGKAHIDNETVKRANKWYEDAQFKLTLEPQLDKMPIKTVRFKDGEMCAADGTKEEIKEQMRLKFPDKEIEAIT